MKIGLVRHFKVKHELRWSRRFTPRELRQWFEEYDAADVEPGEVALQGISWQRCLSSDMPRAAQTATGIFPGPVEQTPRLREVPGLPIFQAEVRLPMWLWALLVPLAWKLRHPSQSESREQVEQRVREALEEALRTDGNVLIVSHGVLMRFLRAELLRRGFRGPKISRRPPNGALYVFEK